MPKELKILVVDDEEVMRNLFTDILRDEGYEVTTVCNGKEAEEIAKKIASFPPDAVRKAKQAIIRGLDLSLSEGLDLERKLASGLA